MQGMPMTTARIFKSGNSQAVRLPKEFRFSSDEVEIFRRGDEVVLRERPRGMAEAFDIIANLDLDWDAIEALKKERPEERDFGDLFAPEPQRKRRPKRTSP
jgi:antitoxin VapB